MLYHTANALLVSGNRFAIKNSTSAGDPCMDILTTASPVLKVLFERLGKPEISNYPSLLKPGGHGAVIVSNHVGWADSLWMAYAIYPRQLHYMSKQELFKSTLSRWVLEHGGSIELDRIKPAPSSIKTSVELLRQGELFLIFPSGTRNQENTIFKRGAATIALHAQVPIVPVFYKGPTNMHPRHIMNRPHIQLSFGEPIQTENMLNGKTSSHALTKRLKIAIEKLEFENSKELAFA